MTKAELLDYWVKSSDEDYNTMIHLYEKKRLSLGFICRAFGN